MAKQKKLDIVIPEIAAGLGPIMTGELRSKDHLYPEVLAQFSKIVPHTRKARLYLYLTIKQAKRIYGVNGPFRFQGSFVPQQDVIELYTADDIWLNPVSQITNYDANYWTQTSGKIGSLTVRKTCSKKTDLESLNRNFSAWFVAGRCFAWQIMASNGDEEKVAAANSVISNSNASLTLSSGAHAIVRRYTRLHSFGATRELKRKGYSITVNGNKNAEAIKADVDTLLVLASFASRERSINAHWSHGTKEDLTRVWNFNFRRFKRRLESEDPLVPRNSEKCHAFLQQAFEAYSASKHQSLLDAAIFALLAESQTIEMRIAHLFSGVQGALLFATNSPETARPRIGELYRRFIKSYANIFDGLWPLLDPRSGLPLAHFRHAIVHGEAFSESEWLALSYAGDHLQWHLERIILAALGWDYQESHVSDKSLRRYYAHRNWQVERSKVKARQ